MITDELAAQSEPSETETIAPKRLARLTAHEVVPGLCAHLYRQRFHKDLEWGQGDGAALSRLLGMNPHLTINEVEVMIHAYYASDFIPFAQQPYEWLPKLMKYQHGPLDAQGTPKAELARIDAEVAKANAAMAAEAERRRVEERSKDKEALLDRAIARVGRDLLSKGYEVFRPVGPATCHLVATDRIVSRRTQALRITVLLGDTAPSANSRCYQALVPIEGTYNPLNAQPLQQTIPIRYEPPLAGL
jgi:hypothetical protein